MVGCGDEVEIHQKLTAFYNRVE
jgi:hypothetical protein